MRAWSKEDIDLCIFLVYSGFSFIETAFYLNKGSHAVRLKMNRLGIMQSLINPKPTKTIKYCIVCSNTIENYGIKFCSHSCSAIYNNTGVCRHRKYIYSDCKYCSKPLRNNRMFCNKHCYVNYNNYVRNELIESGIHVSSVIIKKYLIEKYGNKCMECGWNKVNSTTNKVPIELEHIDGNSENNNLENLKLLCPNCHSLTPTYKALNKGNGRFNRMQRYNENKSY